MLVNDAGQPIHPLHKIIPGNDFSVPIEAVTRSRIVIQPDRKYTIGPVYDGDNGLYRGLRLQVVLPGSMGGSHLEERFYYEMSAQ
jgi:hypothetical protein